MPFIPRPFLVMLAFIAGFFLISYFSVSSLSFTFSPLLFPSTTLITLTDDNSTYFVSRPAAFGPSIAKSGLVGELYVLDAGELACGEATGFDSRIHSAEGALPDLASDGTDDIRSTPIGVEDSLGTSVIDKAGTQKDASVVGLSDSNGEGVHADIESLQQSAAINGKIVLVKRGGCGFLEKVLWAQRRGAIALIVGDNEPGRGLVTMYAKGHTSNVSIPSVFTSHTTAHLLTSLLPVNFKKPGSHPKGPTTTSSATPTSTSTLAIDADGEVVKPTNTPAVLKVDGQPHLGHGDDDAYDRPDITAPTSKRPTFNASKKREGLWLTLTPGGVSSSPFFDTLLVMVVSPLITLTVVYAMLTIRSHIRRRRWRAPKSYVERLPVRTYHPANSNSSDSAWRAADSMENGNGDGEGRRMRRHRRRPGFQGSSEECVVCLEEYIDGVSRVMKLPCGHEFHEGCITPWLITRRRTCPICKGDVVRYMDSTASESDSDVDSDVDDRDNSAFARRDEDARGGTGTGAGRDVHSRSRSASTGRASAGRGGSRRVRGADERTPLVQGE